MKTRAMEKWIVISLVSSNEKLAGGLPLILMSIARGGITT